MIDRRFFLKSSGLALIGGTLVPNVFAKMAGAATTKGRKTLVAIFQRGAVDGLNVVVPYAEQAYYAARPGIAIARESVIDLDGFFGLHPSLASLMPYWKDHALAFVHAAGSPDATRSHFDAQDFMECGTPGIKTTADGFLARAVTPIGSPLRAVSMTSTLPRILSGRVDAVAMTDLSRFGVRGDVSPMFEALYEATRGGAFDAAKMLKSAEPQKLQPEHGASYPANALGNSLKQIAQLIKSNVGLEIAFADTGGWDTHAAEGGVQGQLANNLRTFGDAIAAFIRDLGSRMSDVVLVTMSEFGRTVRENGNRGTDHGHATVMLVAGGGVKGGRVYGEWPGLANLYEGRDLRVTTDFRDVFAELLTKHLGVTSMKSVFPNYDAKWRGLTT